jgi:hypothetical protein
MNLQFYQSFTIAESLKNFFISLIKEFLPLAFAFSITIFLYSGLAGSFSFLLKFLILSIVLTILYNWIYVANEYAAKYEPANLRTIRFKQQITLTHVAVTFLIRVFVSQLIVQSCFVVGLFNLNEFLGFFLVEGLLVAFMVLHQVFSFEVRSLSTLPMLRILRILFIFFPLSTLFLENYWTFVYSVALMIPHLLNYFGLKLVYSLNGMSQQFKGSDKRFLADSILLPVGLIFIVFLVFSFFLFTNLSVFRILVYPTLIFAYLCIFELTKKTVSLTSDKLSLTFCRIDKKCQSKQCEYD